jgi:type VI protein secretion system component VasF
MAALFFSQRKPRGFNYTPRYYDPEAEAREERKKIVLGEKYRSPARRAREEAAEKARTAGDSPAESAAAEYVPGAYLREHIAARRNVRAADVMRKRRKKRHSVPVLIGILALIALIAYMLYFK